jgi:subtilase family serine protease
MNGFTQSKRDDGASQCDRYRFRLLQAGLFFACIALLLLPPCSALYDFDGFPLKTISQGQVDGRVFQYTILGLDAPPRTLSFEVPAEAEIQWARTYVGVWGGTPHYTGWVQVTANGNDMGQVKLYGSDDKTQNVWCTGYGVYWTAWDTTTLVRNGQNTIVATTSAGLPESKLDGRIYGITTVIVAKTPDGPDTRYWIMEGNVNLHGEGWTAGANPTVNDNTSVTFSVPDLSGSPHANLTTIELTSTYSLPDYVQFNGKDLGSPATDYVYAAGAYDIADEKSYDNGYLGPGETSVLSRYWDIEIFDVTSLVKTGDNTVRFLRGRDLNGDNFISSNSEPYEGEDYLHPVFAMLTLEKPRSASGVTAGSSNSGTDLAIGKLDVVNAYKGQTATIRATLQNLGARPGSPVPVAFSVDGSMIETKQVTVDASGVQEISANWPATDGAHTVSVEVKATGDSNSANNIATKTVTVGSLPDLEVSIGAPKSPGSSSDNQKSPLPAVLAIPAVVLSFAAYRILRRQEDVPLIRGASLLFAVLMVSASLPVLIPAVTAGDTTKLYLIPVTVKNIGGSDAGAFAITLYLDGEKIATKTYDDGLAAGKEVTSDIPVHTTPGSHTIKVIVDEAAKVMDGNRGNNAAESSHAFP